jgi:hypothetical protein
MFQIGDIGQYVEWNFTETVQRDEHTTHEDEGDQREDGTHVASE